MEFTIQGRGLPFEETEILPISFKTDQSGTFVIEMLHGSGIFNHEQPVYLIDYFQNQVHPLSSLPYSFNSTPGVFSERFSLQFTSNSLALGNEEIDSIQIAIREEKVFITSLTALISTVQLYDVTGKKVTKEIPVEDTSTVIPVDALSKGVYFLSLTIDNGVVFVKKIIL